MPEQTSVAGATPIPTDQELKEIMADLDFFLDMEEAEALPLDAEEDLTEEDDE